MIDAMDVPLDILGQQLMTVYTQITLCYPYINVSGSQAHITSTLTRGLARLSASFPWTAGQVVGEGAGEGNTGTFSIRSLNKTPVLYVKDLSQGITVPTMEALIEADFPMAMLDESSIAPHKTLPFLATPPPKDSPAFAAQATFIQGGVLLTFVGQHQCMDMVGQGQMMYLLSKACRGEDFTQEELDAGNVDRRNFIPLLDDSCQPGAELEPQLVKPALPDASSGPAPTPPPPSSWANFAFSGASLVALKAFASETVPSGYVSTDDALTAFIWQSVSRTRLHRLESGAKSTIARAVDVRRYLDIPSGYPGCAQNMAYGSYALQQLIDAPLGEIAANLRSAVDPKTSDVAYRTKALATYLARTPDKSTVSYTAPVDPSTGIMLSSWAKEKCYDLDFGLGLGKPEAVRRPRFEPYEGLMYLLPKRPDGEVVLAISLRDDDMSRLKGHAEWQKYARYIG